MPTVRSSYYIGDCYAGSADEVVLRTNGNVPAVWLRPLAYFCPHCGEVWARRIFASSANLPTDFLVEMQPCSAHGSGLLFATEYGTTFPTHRLLLRELTLLLKGHKWTRN